MKPSEYSVVFHTGNPPEKGLYETKRNGVSYVALRYWDGKEWWSITYGRKNSKMKEVEDTTLRSSGVSEKYKVLHEGYAPHKVKMRDQRNVCWAKPKAEYSDKQMIDFLIGRGLAPSRDTLNKEMALRYKEPTGE